MLFSANSQLVLRTTAWEFQTLFNFFSLFFVLCHFGLISYLQDFASSFFPVFVGGPKKSRDIFISIRNLILCLILKMSVWVSAKLQIRLVMTINNEFKPFSERSFGYCVKVLDLNLVVFWSNMINIGY